MLHALLGTMKLRELCGGSAGPPNGPMASRVSATRQGVTGIKSDAVDAPAPSFTVNVCPAMMRVPDRGSDDGLAAAVKETVPVPVPLAPAVTRIQSALLTAVHA